MIFNIDRFVHQYSIDLGQRLSKRASSYALGVVAPYSYEYKLCR